MIQEFQKSRDQLRVMAKQNLLKMQEDNKKTYNRKCSIVSKHKRSDLVFTEQIQFGSKLQIETEIFRTYRINRVKCSDLYEILHVSDCERLLVINMAED